jgi:hypothetical protein
MMSRICKKRVMAYLMNYPGTDLIGVRNTMKKQGRIPHDLPGI